MNSANLVTCIRVLLVPLVVIIYYSPLAWGNLLAAALFGIASITDWLDGYLARRLNQTSDFGAFLDPVADKLLVVVAMVFLTAAYPSPWFVLPAAIIIAREVFVSALREWMASKNQRDAVAVGYVGKLKTTSQMVAILILIAAMPGWPDWFWQTGYALIYLSAVLSLWSMVGYLRKALPALDLK